MITFLNSVRDLTPNGFEMFHCAEYVLLGHNAPSKQWEQNIANSLIQSLNVKSAKWLKLVGPYLTPELVLEALLSKPELFTVRPALIYQILENLKVPKSTVGFESTRLDESLLLVDDKLKSESQKDFLFALQALRDQNQFLESMRKLSDGRVPNGVEAAELFVANAAGRKLSKFAAMLCGLPNWVEAVRPTLQPPYAQYCRDYITAEGGSFVVNVTLTEAAGVKVTLIDRFKSSLTLFGDHHHMFYKEEALSISNTVVQVLFRADIGILGQRPVRSMFDHPLLQQLYQKSTKGYEHAHTQHLKQYEKWKNDGCQGQPPNSWLLGFQILKALRNVASHSSDHTELLMLMGWRPVVLDSIVSAFEKRAKETPWGFFYSADKKCFKLPENVLAQVSKSGNNNRSRGFVKQNRA
jgi:hypothetical protein